MTKHRHHFVPAGLSSGFCKEQKRLYLYDLQGVKIFPSSPKDAFVQEHYHSVEKDGQMDHDFIEDLLNEMEWPGISVIRKFMSQGFIEDRERQDLAVFCALQYVRTPQFRQGTEAFLKETGKVSGQILEDMGEMPPIPEEWRKYGDTFSQLVDTKAVDIKIMPQVTMMGMVAVKKASDAIEKMNWCLLESKEDNYFALGDHPCALFDEFSEQHAYGLNLANPGLELTFPLGANHCLLAGWKGMPLRSVATKQRVIEINKRSALFAHRFIAYPSDSQKMLSFFSKYSEGHPEADVQTLPCPGKNGLGYMIVSRQNIFKSPKMKQLYLSCSPLF